VTLRLRYEPPEEPAAPAPDADAALYALADAGAAAVIELEGYALPVDGTGLAELHRQAVRLLDVLDGGEPAPGDDDLRAELPGVPPDAVLHSWLFASYMVQLPVVIFAIDGPLTTVFTRTRDETPGWPLIVLDGRDRREPIFVATDALAAEVRHFLDGVTEAVRAVITA
jgi:hypothetical protein